MDSCESTEAGRTVVGGNFPSGIVVSRFIAGAFVITSPKIDEDSWIFPTNNPANRYSADRVVLQLELFAQRRNADPQSSSQFRRCQQFEGHRGIKVRYRIIAPRIRHPVAGDRNGKPHVSIRGSRTTRRIACNERDISLDSRSGW